MFRELFDGISPMPQYALLAVDERDVAHARTSVAVAFIEGNATALAAQCPGV